MNRNRFLKFLRIGIVFAVWLAAVVGPAGSLKAVSAQAPLAWPTISLVEVKSGLADPTYVTSARDGSGRLFIVEQAGQIRILKNGAWLASPFLDIRGRVKSGGEEGLLSVAFPPGFASKGSFYVYYTNQDGNNVVSRFRVSSNPDQALPGSEETILLIPHPGQTNHNGGQLAFGPDGYLYIGTGDGGGGGDPNRNAQNPASLLGKILRVDVEFSASAFQGGINTYLPLLYRAWNTSSPAVRYRIPPDNPFAGNPAYRPEIWALGLRNPWRFSFDRQTGDLFIGDVGQGSQEEIDFQPDGSPGGQNYGWNILEGTACYGAGSCTPPTNYAPPVFTYTHAGGNCSVTGGMRYRGPAYPAMQGVYFLADFCSGKLWGLRKAGNGWESQALTNLGSLMPTTFGEDEAGEMYVTGKSGKLFRLQAQP